MKGASRPLCRPETGNFKQGHVGLCCTTFAATSSFQIESLIPVQATAEPARLERRNAILLQSVRCIRRSATSIDRRSQLTERKVGGRV